jgi:Major Facilitator Superfamily
LAGVFAWFGAVLGSFAVIALDVQKSVGLGPGAFGALLAAGFALAACAQLAGGALAERCGEGGALRRIVPLWTAAVVAAVVAPATVPLAVAVVAVLAGAGALNATLNACATGAVAGSTRKFVHYHAAYSAGAFGGAVIAAIIEGVGASWRVVWLALALVGSLLVIPAARVQNRSEAPSAAPTSMRSVLSLLQISAIRHLALLLFAAVTAASAVDTWGVRFLRVEHDMSVVGGAGAYAVAQAVAVAARLQLVPSSNLRRTEPVVVASGLLAAGLIIECTGTIAWTSAVGLTVAAVAGALLVPLLLARSGIGARPAAAVAAVGAVGQLGFVAGPALVGATTALAGSAAGLLGVAGLAIVTAVAAHWRLTVDGAAGVNDSVSAMTRRVERR